MNRFSQITAALVAVLLAAGVTGVYWNHFDNAFQFDDWHAVVENPHIRSLANIPRFFTDGATFSSLPANQTYRPVVLTTLALDYWMGGGLNPVSFHLDTFVVFILQGVLMALLFRKVLRSSEAGAWAAPAVFAVAWYLLHPANAETINYVSARSDSLSTFFVLLGLVLYGYSPYMRRTRLYLVPAVVAILCKAQAAVFAPLLWLCAAYFEDASPAGNSHRRKPGRVPVGALPALGVSVLGLVFVRVMTPQTWTPGGTSFYRYVITQPYVIFRYLRAFFLPFDLSADTDWTPFDTVKDDRFILGAAFLLGLIALVIFLSRRPRLRPMAFGLLWFLIALVPTSFVVPLAEVTNDHRLFFPYVGLTLSASWALFLVADRIRQALSVGQVAARVAGVVLAVLLLAGYARTTYGRNEVWDSNESLWHDVTVKSPKNGRGLMNYGLARMRKGDFATAETYFSRALRYVPHYALLHVNMGVLKAATKRPVEAEACFRKAIACAPDDPASHFYFARFLHQQGKSTDAVRELEKTLAVSPAHMEARHLLMRILHERGQRDRLAEVARQTLGLLPTDERAELYLRLAEGKVSRAELAAYRAASSRTPESYLALSLVLYEEGEYAAAVDAARQAIRLRPGYARAYNNICAACNRLGLWDDAIAAGEMAVKLDPAGELARNNLEWARQQKARGAPAETATPGQ